MRGLNRRQFVQAALGAPLVASSVLKARPGRAATATEKGAVVLIWLDGGYNSLFSAADGCIADGAFGVTEARVRDLGNGLVVDSETFGTLPDNVLAHMTTAGVLHGYADHVNGKRVWWNIDRRGASYPLRLASALGGASAFRCVAFSSVIGAHPATDGVAMSVIPDVSSALLATGASSESGLEVPARAGMALGLEAALALSRGAFLRSPNMLREYYEGLHTAKTALAAPEVAIDWPEIAQAYGLGNSMAITDMPSQLAATELMVRSGTDVVIVQDNARDALVGFGWDSHNDEDGLSVRTMMQRRLPALKTFLARMLALQNHNVVVAILGDFSRSGHQSGHAAGLSATVLGKRLRTGTTGRAIMDGPNYVLPSDTPGVSPFYALLAEAAGATSPFGANPHTALFA